MKSSTADSDSAFSDEDDAGSEEWEQTRQDENVGFETVAAEPQWAELTSTSRPAEIAPATPCTEIPSRGAIDGDGRAES